MSTINKERLQWLVNISGRDDIEDIDGGEIRELARIALASLEAEPAYFINRVKHSDAYGEDVELRTYCYELDALKSKDDFGGEVVPVYTAPPATFALPVQHWEELCRQNPDMSIGDAIIRSAWWNHCAAMLQGAEPVTTAYKLPDGWVACSERMPEEYDYEIWTYSPTKGINHSFGYDGYDLSFSDGEMYSTINDVTHWMPIELPAVPQQ